MTRLLLHRQQSGRQAKPSDWPGGSARPWTLSGRSASTHGVHATSMRSSSLRAPPSITAR